MNDILNWLLQKEDYIVSHYQVDPLIFIILEVLTTPFYFYAWSKIIKDFKKTGKYNFKWINILLMVILIPYLYIFLWGRNIPWYIYLLFIIFLISVCIRNYFRFKKIL